MPRKSLQSQIECSIFANLKESHSLRDNACLNTVSLIHAAAWLLAIPNSKLGLAMALHEFVIAVKLWLGIPISPDFPKAILCMCGHTIDSFGDHLLGCGHGSLRSRRHNALRDISITRYLLMMLVHSLRSIAVALLSIVLGMSTIPISQTASLLILMFPFGIPCSLCTLYHLQLWLELLHLLETKKQMLITRRTWKLQADVSTL